MRTYAVSHCCCSRSVALLQIGIVLEYMDGGTLADVLKKVTLGQRRRVAPSTSSYSTVSN